MKVSLAGKLEDGSKRSSVALCCRWSMSEAIPSTKETAVTFICEIMRIRQFEKYLKSTHVIDVLGVEHKS